MQGRCSGEIGRSYRAAEPRRNRTQVPAPPATMGSSARSTRARAAHIRSGCCLVWSSLGLMALRNEPTNSVSSRCSQESPPTHPNSAPGFGGPVPRSPSPRPWCARRRCFVHWTAEPHGEVEGSEVAATSPIRRYYMLHATDHPAAPKLMTHAYNTAVLPAEPEEQLRLALKHVRR
jgi:hypothetical protein